MWFIVISFFCGLIQYNDSYLYFTHLAYAGLVEAWVGGGSWEQVTKDCSLDQGDTARLLSRTADLLRQVHAILYPSLLPSFKQSVWLI